MSPPEGSNTTSRASRACVACRALKSRCVGLEEPPCKRCRKHGLDCTLLPSLRGKTPRSKRTDAVSSSVRMKQMQETLDAVLRTLGSTTTGADGTTAKDDSGDEQRSSDGTQEINQNDSHRPVDSPPNPASWNFLHASGPSLGTRHSPPSSPPFLGLSPTCAMDSLPDTVLEAFTRARTQAPASTSDQELLAQLFQPSAPSDGHHLPPITSPPTSQGSVTLHEVGQQWFEDNASLGGNWSKAEQRPSPPPGSAAHPAANFSYSLSVSSNSPTAVGPRLDKAPLELLAEVSRARLQDPSQDKDAEPASKAHQGPEVGIASDRYFQNEVEKKSRLGEKYTKVCSELNALLDNQSQRQLFDIFMTHMNAHSRVLNEIYHTFERVANRSEFLLSAICASAAKFLPSVQHMQPTLTKLTSRLSRGELGPEWRSVETIQAFLCLAIFGTDPGESAAADPLWYHLGSALRMAVDLNLHRRTKPEDLAGLFEEEEIEMEILNRERTFILLYSCDRSTSAQRNKPVTLQENWLINGVADWGWKLEHDRRTSGYAELQSLSYMFASVFRTEDSEGNVECLTSTNFHSIFMTFERQLAMWKASWQRRSMYLPSMTEAHYQLQLDAIEFYEAYNRLLLCSFGLQHDLLQRPLHMSASYQKCRAAATHVLHASMNHLGETMKYSPNAHFLFSSYAAMYLLKLASMHQLSTDEECSSTLATIETFIRFLHRIAVNPHHTPNLYAHFLTNMVRHFKRSRGIGATSSLLLTTAPHNENLYTSHEVTDGMMLDFTGQSEAAPSSLGFFSGGPKAGSKDDWASMLFPDVFDSMPNALGLMDGLQGDSWT